MTRLAFFAIAIALAACSPSATPTPAPTATPEPAATPDPTATPDANVAVLEYVDWAIDTGIESARLVGDLGEQMGKAGGETALLRDEKWSTDTIAILVSIKKLSLGIQDRRDVPPAAESVHRKMLDLATELKTVAQDMADGIDYLDANKIQSSNAAMDRAKDLNLLIAPELGELGQDAQSR